MTAPVNQNCGWLAPIGRSVDVMLRHIPLGSAWLAFRIPGKRFNRMMTAFADLYEDAWAVMCSVATELDPRTTTQLLSEWETAVSLPDNCLPAATTLDDRRAQVIFRLTKKRWVTVQDWKDLATLFGLTIAVTPGWFVQKPALFGDFNAPLQFDIFPKLGRFRVYVDVTNIAFTGFEYGAPGQNLGVGWPIPFQDDASKFSAFQCIIERVKPAHVVVIWNAFPHNMDVETHEPFTDPFSPTF